MLNVELNDLLSDGDDEALDEIEERFLSIDQLIKGIVDENCSKTWLWPRNSQCLKRGQDIDVGYAIGLLKKTDQNTNVYEHLQNILDKILLERPKNPLQMFEKYSLMLKRTYMYRNVNFERVFVDHISQPFCLRTLEMYKCSRKKEHGKRKAKYHDNNDGDVDVNVQNLWEVNNMFSKAGCGLPSDEVSSLSLTMNAMAELNKFKSVRFWGKIFGLKKMYFVIECEWSDAELQRRLSTESRRDAKSPTRVETAPDGNRVSTTVSEPPTTMSELFASMNKKNAETESVESVVPTAPGGGTADGGVARLDDGWRSSSVLPDGDAAFCVPTSKAPSEVLPAETYGVGANRNIYFVTNDLNAKWIELDSVSPRSIVEARNARRYFTGKLYDPVSVNASSAKFVGLEIEYLRAQIARISSSTQICPQGYYAINKKYITQNEISDFQSTSSDESSRKYNFDYILNETVKPISNTNLIDCKYWAHKSPRIEDNGVTNYVNLSVQTLSINDHDSEEIDFNQDEYDDIRLSHNDSQLNVAEELFGNVRHDVTDDNTPAWTGALCSPFDRRYSYYTTMKSNIWPGAYAVAYRDKTDFVYIGWAQKQVFSGNLTLTLNLLDEIQVENIIKEDLVEYPDPTKEQIAQNNTKIKIRQRTNNITSFTY